MNFSSSRDIRVWRRERPMVMCDFLFGAVMVSAPLRRRSQLRPAEADRYKFKCRVSLLNDLEFNAGV